MKMKWIELVEALIIIIFFYSFVLWITYLVTGTLLMNDIFHGTVALFGGLLSYMLIKWFFD